MAPEVLNGESGAGAAQADVYSFAVVMWEIATRDVPWADFDKVDFMSFVETLQRLLPTGVRPRVPDEVDRAHPAYCAVMRRCWATQPDERPTFTDIESHLLAAEPDGTDTGAAVDGGGGVKGRDGDLLEPLLP